MKVATIVPRGHFDAVEDDTFHMVLAHLVPDQAYRGFFVRAKRDRGGFLLMDNGVVETGKPMEMTKLLDLAGTVGADEVILPDEIGDSVRTLRLSEDSLAKYLRLNGSGALRLMAVPQGRTVRDWSRCAEAMADWPVQAFGISRFGPSVEGYSGWMARVLLLSTPGGKRLREGGKDLHLLGCGSFIGEAGYVDSVWPGRIRSTDSGVATMATEGGLRLEMGQTRVGRPFDLDSKLDKELLRTNVRVWRASCEAGEVLARGLPWA